MAPELIKGERKYTTKIDIWSFGIFAMEMADGDQRVARINHLRDLSDTLEECFDLHAEQIDSIRQRVIENEAIVRGQPAHMETNQHPE